MEHSKTTFYRKISHNTAISLELLQLQNTTNINNIDNNND